MRKNSVKNNRINGEVQRELSRIISREIKDPRISPMTSVVDSTFAGLTSAMGYIRRELAHSVNLRNTPEITFIMDQSIEYGVNMSHKIDEAIGKHGDETEDITDDSDDSEE